MQNKNFYDSLSSVYDDMIDFDSALKRRIDLLSNIIGDYKTAADFGCGTGIDSIALSKLGLHTDAFDQSEDMITRAKLNASNYKADVNFFSSPLECITSQNKYDLIVSLGNTLANLNKLQLKKTLDTCNGLLSEKGKIIIQILNFNLIKDNIHTINETESSKYIVKRYYERTGGSLLFKIRIIDKEDRIENLIETPVFPHSGNLIAQLCNDANLGVDFFGGLDLRGFDIDKSGDLVCIAERK